MGSAHARPELQAAVARAQDEIVVSLVKMLEPCRERGWFRPGIDLTSTVAWWHSVMVGRVHLEVGAVEVDFAEWDRLSIGAVERAFFGD